MTEEYLIEQAKECFDLCGRRDIMLDEEKRLNIGKTLLHLLGLSENTKESTKYLNMAWNNYVTRSSYIIMNPPKI